MTKFAIMAFGKVYAENLTLQEAKNYYNSLCHSSRMVAHIKKY